MQLDHTPLRAMDPRFGANGPTLNPTPALLLTPYIVGKHPSNCRQFFKGCCTSVRTGHVAEGSAEHARLGHVNLENAPLHSPRLASFKINLTK